MSRIILASGAYAPSSNNYWATWSILDACNYKCWYCPIRKNQYASDDVIDRTIPVLQQIAVDKKLEVTLFGGEPTLHPRLQHIIYELFYYADVKIFTNFSADNDFYTKLSEDYNVTYTMSYHPDVVRDNEFCEKLDSFDAKWAIGHINIMLVAGIEERSWHVAEKCRELKIRHRILPVCELGNTSAYLKSIAYSKRDDVISVEDAYIVDNRSRGWMSDEECKVYGQNQFRGYRCWKWKTSCFIDHKGRVYGCLRDQENKVFDKIENFDYYMHDIEKSCPYDSCICENYIPKELAEGYADTYLKGLTID